MGVVVGVAGVVINGSDPRDSVGFGITNANSPLNATVPGSFSLRFVSGSVTAYHAK